MGQSISCCRGPTESKNSKLWHRNSAYEVPSIKIGEANATDPLTAKPSCKDDPAPTKYADGPRLMTYMYLGEHSRHRTYPEAASCTPRQKQMTANLVVCSKCGTVDRLLPSRPTMDAKCRRCRVKLIPGMSMPRFSRPDSHPERRICPRGRKLGPSGPRVVTAGTNFSQSERGLQYTHS